MSDKLTDFAAFISYAKADQTKAQEIVASREERGLKCWIAPGDVRPGHSYGDEIIIGIGRSRAFILVLSAASNESSDPSSRRKLAAAARPELHASSPL